MAVQAISAAFSNLVNPAESLSAQGTLGSAGASDGTALFKNVYDELISNVNSTDAAFQGDIVKAAAGEFDNPQQLLIDSQKANIALQMTISVRNKALEAYNDIVRMQV